MIFSHVSVGFGTEPHNNVSKNTVIHILAAFQHNISRIYIQFVTLLDMIIKYGSTQVICTCYSMKITGEMQIKLIHRNDLRITASGSTALDKYTFSLQFGLLTRESEGAVDILPALKLRCLCVRRPVLTAVTMKAGEARGMAAVDELKVSLEGIDTVEEGIVLLTGDMIDALANAADAGELKLRVEGQYKTFDISLEELDAAARVGQLAREIAR